MEIRAPLKSQYHAALAMLRQMIEYCDLLDGLVDPTLDDVDLTAETCGFYWYDLPKLDHEILSIRHVQHHVGQLAERLRIHAGLGIDGRA